MKIGKLLLYHGSNMVIDSPEWNHGSRFRDALFAGRGASFHTRTLE